MVQKGINDLEVNTKPAYMYYLASKSGQCSPTSDTLDSGTGSDLEISTSNKHAYHLQSSLSNAVTKSMRKFNDLSLDVPNNQQRRLKSRSSNDSYNTDSEESESSLSCDSLNSAEIHQLKNSSSTTTAIIRHAPFGESAAHITNTICVVEGDNEGTVYTSDENNVTKINFLPHSLLRDIRDRSTIINSIKNPSHSNTFITHIDDSNNNGVAHQNDDNNLIMVSNRNQQFIDNVSDKPSANVNYTNEPFNLHPERRNNVANNNNNNTHNNNTNKECDRLFFQLNASKSATEQFERFVQNENKKSIYENDKYINFHLNECVANNNINESTSVNAAAAAAAESVKDDSFAGFRDVRQQQMASTIRSSKGTIRGVKNRVRNGIATFLQMQQTNVKNYKEKDAGKVVLYSTSMGIVRETYAKCANVKQILRTLLIKFEERDIFMSAEYQQEIKDRMQSLEIQVPQLFVDGQYIGDADQVERLNECGELRQLLKSYKSANSLYTCQICGGYRVLPCPSCNGSKKSVHRNHFTTEFVALKCMNCDEVGLVKCYNCD